MEEHWGNRANRNEKQARLFDIRTLENFITTDDKFPLYLIKAEDWALLDEHMEQTKPDVVFIDSMTRCCPSDIESSGIGSEIMSKIKGLSKKHDTAIVIIHHSTKQSEIKPMNEASMAGSRVLMQEADFIIGVNKIDTGEKIRYIKEISCRYSEESDEVQVFEFSKDMLTVPLFCTPEYSLIQKALRLSDGRIDSSQKDRILCFFQENPSKHTPSEILKKADLICDLRTVQRSIKELLREGKIIKHKNGIYQIANAHLNGVTNVASDVSSELLFDLSKIDCSDESLPNLESSYG